MGGVGDLIPVEGAQVLKIEEDRVSCRDLRET
jgi:hypothetical protein